MEYHKYSAIPIISRTGRYIGTLTEGDLLWGIKNQYHLDLKGAEKIPITAIKRRLDNRPVKADADMEDLIGKALNQNFVPVLDDQKCFIGIITRKDIIQYFYKKASSRRKSGLNARKKEKSETVCWIKCIKEKRQKSKTLCTLLRILCYYNRRNPPIHYIVFATPHKKRNTFS